MIIEGRVCDELEALRQKSRDDEMTIAHLTRAYKTMVTRYSELANENRLLRKLVTHS